MRRYLGQAVRIEKTWIYLDVDTTYNPEHIEQMESIAHLWCDQKICVRNGFNRIVADDIQLILDSPTILQSQLLFMSRAHFSFKDYELLYNPKTIENTYYGEETDPDYWPQFLEQPGVKPLVVLRELHRESINTVIEHLSKTFSSAISPNAFKIVLAENREPLTEFQKTNETSGIEERTSNWISNGEFEQTFEWILQLYLGTLHHLNASAFDLNLAIF